MENKSDKKKILIVDDDDFIIDLYAEALQKAGYTVFTANLPSIGLAKVELTHPDLVLLDIGMPEMNGLQFLDKIKNNLGTNKIPVMFLSNIRDDQTIKEGLEKGAVGYLLKTALTPSQVAAEVGKTLQQITALDSA